MTLWRRPGQRELSEFEAFVTQDGAALTVLARSLTSSQADADDLLQETLTRTLENWHRVADAQSTHAYVRRIMVTTCAGLWRRRKREILDHAGLSESLETRQGSIIWGSPKGDSEISLVGDRDALLQALRRLPLRQRMVATLRYLEDMPDTEIAEILGISPTTVRTSAMRAIKALREPELVPET